MVELLMVIASQNPYLTDGVISRQQADYFRLGLSIVMTGVSILL
jgi:hypothetical protein